MHLNTMLGGVRGGMVSRVRVRVRVRVTVRARGRWYLGAPLQEEVECEARLM